MPGSGTGTFIDSDDYQASLSHLRIDLLVTSQGAFVTYLVSQGVNPNIISAKGFGDTHPVAPNDMPQGRRKTCTARRIRRALLMCHWIQRSYLSGSRSARTPR